MHNQEIPSQPYVRKKQDINIVTDGYVPINEALFNRFIAENYDFSVSGLSIKEENYQSLVDVLNTYTLVDNSDFKISVSQEYNYLQFIADRGEKFIICIEKNSDMYSFDIHGSSISICSKIFKLVKPLLGTKQYDKEIIVDVMLYDESRGSITSTQKVITKEEVEHVSQDYYPYLDCNELFKQFLAAKEKVLLLNGIPGVGKSKLIETLYKYLFTLPPEEDEDLEEPKEVRAAYIKNNTILCMDKCWELIINNRYDFILIDDIDDILTSRDIETHSRNNKNNFITHFLSYTDGIFKSKGKVIITTNQSLKNIDEAILRKGRTFDILELIPLSYEEAKQIWKTNKLPENLFDELFEGRKDILQCDLGSEIQKYQDLQVTKTLPKYCKREGISKVNFSVSSKISL